MKSLVLSLAALFCAAVAFAQYPVTTTETTYDLPAGKRVEMNLKFAGDIVVKTWERDALGLTVRLMRSEAALEKVHELTVTEGADRLRVAMDYAFDKDWEEKYQCWSCDAPKEGCVCLRVDYEIHLPPDADLALETISGNIEIRGLQGPLRAKSISGFVDVGRSPRLAGDLRFRSVTGEIFTDFDDIGLDKGSTPYSKRLTTALNGGGSRVELETVSGNIYFRKN